MVVSNLCIKIIASFVLIRDDLSTRFSYICAAIFSSRAFPCCTKQIGTLFKAHKLILAACSKNFADLFETTPPSQSCVIILEQTSADNMSALLEFMYKGEVHVSQEALNSFLKAAENLQVSVFSLLVY